MSLAGIGVLAGSAIDTVTTLVMGAGTTALAYVAWYACQRSLSATSAGAVQLVIPVLTVLGAVVLLAEPFGGRLVVAALLVGLGMWLGQPARGRAVSR